MPWKESSLLGERLRFVRAVVRRRDSIARLCVQFGISQKTGFKWLRRYEREGGPGLKDRSRRPRRCPRRLAGRWPKRLIQLRRKHPQWGAKKLHACLRREHPASSLPSGRTLHRWLKGLGMVRRRARRARRGPALPRAPLTRPQAPNEVWTVDFKGWFRTQDGQRVDPLTVRDLFSRFILGIKLCRPSYPSVRRHLAEIFRRHGLPRIIRVDHGAPFAGEGALELSCLSAWWLRQGIGVEFTGRARPQDNGAHEQMHRIYAAEVASPPAATPRGQQWRTTRWIQYYNHYRPHEALGQEVPALRYRASRRRYGGRLAPLCYPAAWPTRQVTDHGYVRWRGRLRIIGRAFGTQRVGFKAVSEGNHEVYFGPHLIGLLVDSDPGGMRPARWINAPDSPSSS